MKFDLQIHSKFSKCSITGLKRIINIAEKRGLKGIAITDHNTIKGVEKIKKYAEKKSIYLIIGEEIKTEYGDIIGLFLKSEIKSRKWKEVIKEIKKQKGLVYLPHPYYGHKNLERIAKECDIIEVWNSRLSKEKNKMALKLAKKLKKPFGAGSDAHTPWEIGRSYVDINTELNEESIKKALLKNKKFYGICSHYAYKIFSDIIKAIREKNIKKIFRMIKGVKKLWKCAY